MRLGGSIFTDYDGPAEWIEAVQAVGYSAAYRPVDLDSDSETISAYRDAAEAADVTIAEVGAWGYNPVSPGWEVREAAVEASKRHPELADDIGANCCVNVAGSRGDSWAGPDPDNFDEGTFELVVETVQEILDDVNPDGAEAYERAADHVRAVADNVGVSV